MEPYAAARPLPQDPRLDLASGSLDLHRGLIRFVHPRDPTDLLYEQDIAADESYPPYWAELWPSGIELAHAVSGRSWADVAVLELGCGLGLPSIAAALGGARVLATDRSRTRSLSPPRTPSRTGSSSTPRCARGRTRVR